MATVPHEPSTYAPQRPQWAEFLKIREMWASLAISMMWLAVLFDAVYGPNFVSNSNERQLHDDSLGNLRERSSAFLASASVAKRAFRQGTE